jgi:hypothetical protein
MGNKTPLDEPVPGFLEDRRRAAPAARLECHVSEPKKFWGTSDVQAVRESVVELNRALSQLSMILELSGKPERTDYTTLIGLVSSVG